MPILERESGLKFNVDFFAGYSPERINPGDKEHRLPTIKKVTSGSTPEAADFVDSLYASIITAGTHQASSIKVAEAAKVIENTQRDVNIALMNELALIFNRLGIDTEEVLNAAGSKWNFLPFRPGLVGGHCIGVRSVLPDSQSSGNRLPPGDDPCWPSTQRQHAYICCWGDREANDEQANPGKRARILVLGLTFKENCPDIRNSKVIDVIRELERYGAKIDAYDPWPMRLHVSTSMAFVRYAR